MEEFNGNFEFLKENYYEISHKNEEFVRARDFCMDYVKRNFVNDLPEKLRYFCKNGLDFLKSVPLELIEPHCQDFLEHWYSVIFINDLEEFVIFLVTNFRENLTIPSSFYVFPTVELFQLIKKYFSEQINENFITIITTSAVEQHYNDVYDFIIENYHHLINEEFFAKNFLSPYTARGEVFSTIDIFMRLINHLPNFFNYLGDWKIKCDFFTLEFLCKYNLGRKVDVIDFVNDPNEIQFLKDKKEMIFLNDFVTNRWENSFDIMIKRKEYNLIMVTIINDQYYPNVEEIRRCINEKLNFDAHVRGRRVENLSELRRRNIEPFLNKYPEDIRQEFFNAFFT